MHIYLLLQGDINHLTNPELTQIHARNFRSVDIFLIPEMVWIPFLGVVACSFTTPDIFSVCLFCFSICVYYNVHELYDNLKYILKCLTDGKGMVFGGLPFPVIGCPVRGAGFDYLIGLYWMLEMTDTL